MLARLPPARFMIWSICENTCFTCASKLLAMSLPSLSRVAVCPATQTIFPPSVAGRERPRQLERGLLHVFGGGRCKGQRDGRGEQSFPDREVHGSPWDELKVICGQRRSPARRQAN